MRMYKILFLSMCLVLNTSCKTEDPAGVYADWNQQNISYFSNMKDSTTYSLYKIPAERGGGSYYYKITEAGDPDSISPSLDDVVQVNYRGRMIDGKVFDETYNTIIPSNDSTADPCYFYVNTLVRGWVENLLQMKVGETRTFVLPQELGYGTADVGTEIAPYSTTIWDVQLVRIYYMNPVRSPAGVDL